MGLEVEELEQAEEPRGGEIKSFRGPLGWSVIWVQEEVHRQEPEEDEVVEAIFKHVREWHRFARKAMHERCLKLSLYIVKQHHKDTELLVESQ